MSVCVYSVFVLSCVQVAALRRADPPSKASYRLCKRIKDLKKTPRSNKRLQTHRQTDSSTYPVLYQPIFLFISIYTVYFSRYLPIYPSAYLRVLVCIHMHVSIYLSICLQPSVCLHILPVINLSVHPDLYLHVSMSHTSYKLYIRFRHITHYLVTGRGGPYSCETSRLPHFSR
jgi:hypothetical protein